MVRAQYTNHLPEIADFLDGLGWEIVPIHYGICDNLRQLINFERFTFTRLLDIGLLNNPSSVFMVTSAEELADTYRILYWNLPLWTLIPPNLNFAPEIISRYDEYFFENNFLIFVATESGHGGSSRRVASMRDTDEFIEIEIGAVSHDGIFTPSTVDWTFVLEVGRSLLDRTFSITLPEEDAFIVSSLSIATYEDRQQDITPMVNISPAQREQFDYYQGTIYRGGGAWGITVGRITAADYSRDGYFAIYVGGRNTSAAEIASIRDTGNELIIRLKTQGDRWAPWSFFLEIPIAFSDRDILIGAERIPPSYCEALGVQLDDTNSNATSDVNSNVNSDIRVFLNGERLEFDVLPQIISGRTMVPMRAIFEAFGLMESRHTRNLGV